MVFLKPGVSTFDQTKEPLTRAWDLNMRQHYATYQEQVAQNTYRLQKAPRGLPMFGEWNFPYKFQHRYLLLELYQKKKYLGAINPDEVDRFARIQPTIREDLRLTFSPLS